MIPHPLQIMEPEDLLSRSTKKEPAVLIQKYEQGTGGFLRFPRIPKSGKTGTGGSQKGVNLRNRGFSDSATRPSSRSSSRPCSRHRSLARLLRKPTTLQRRRRIFKRSTQFSVCGIAAKTDRETARHRFFALFFGC